jgi:uncharacterized protein (DUF486 family)
VVIAFSQFIDPGFYSFVRYSGQEVITMLVFAGFSVAYMKVPVTRNYFFAAMLLAGAAYLIFSDRS